MEQEYIIQTALDQAVGTDQGQLLKALIPYFPPRQQQLLSVFAKARELSNTMAFFSKEPGTMRMQAAALPAQPLDVINDLRKYCFGNTKKALDQLTNIITMVEMLQIINEPVTEDNCEKERQ